MKELCTSIKSVIDASLDAALLFDIDGNLLYKNLRAIQIFDAGELVEEGSRSSAASFFIFTCEGDRQKMPTWYGLVADVQRNASRKRNDTGCLPAEPDTFDAEAFDIEGKIFPVTVSLATLGGCPCCSINGKEAFSSNESLPLVIAYVRENSDRQQHMVRYLEKEIRRLQSTQSAMDASFDAFISINPNGTILSINKATTSMFGYEPSEMIGKNIAIIMDEKNGRKHSEYIRRYMDTGVKRMIGIRRELEAMHKDGFTFPIELGLVEIKSLYADEVVFCAFVRDVSLRKGHEDNISNKDMLTTALIDASFEPMFLTTSEGTIEMANKAASEVFGYSNAEFMKQNICFICNDKDAKNHDMYIQRYLKTGLTKVMGKKRVLLARKRDGTVFPIELGLREAKLSTGKTYFCGFIRDLSDQNIAEEKLTALLESAFDPMLIVNEEGIIETTNSATSKIFGYSMEELIGENVSILCNDVDRRKHDKYMSRYLATNQKRVIGKERVLAARRKNGATFPIRLGMTEVTIENGSRIFCGFIKDVSICLMS